MAAGKSAMTYRYLGNSGLKVSTICLGTMTFGHKEDGQVRSTEEEAHVLLDRFAAMGGNFIDTADIYQMGQSERIVGNWLSKQSREKFIIATKVRVGWEADNPNATGLGRGRILKAVADSLRRLKTDFIDLYQIHCWDEAVPIEETLTTLNDLVRDGKVRYLGASNLTGWQMQKIVEVSKARGWVPWVSLQQQYSLLSRETEWESLEVCRREGLGVLPWSPLKGGWLSGKMKRGVSLNDLDPGSRLVWASAAAGRRKASHPDYKQFANDERVWNMLDLMENIGKELGKTVAQVALKWLMQKTVVSSVVIGCKTIAQLEDNMGAAGDWQLSEKQMAELDAASDVELPYPYSMINGVNQDRLDKISVRNN